MRFPMSFWEGREFASNLFVGLTILCVQPERVVIPPDVKAPLDNMALPLVGGNNVP